MSSFYLNKKGIIIIIFNSEIRGFLIKNKYNLVDLFKLEQSVKHHIINPISINENLLNQNEICEIYQFNSGIILSCTIFDKSIELNDNNIENNYENINLKDIKKNICDIPLIISYKNNDYSSYNYSKNYFKIHKIQEELKKIKCSNLLERKRKVEKDVKKLDNIKDIREKYIFSLQLLVNDNTNEDLLERYLSLLKEKNTLLNGIFKEYYESFEEEFNYYSKALKESLNKKLYGKEVKSQKYEFLQLIIDICSFNFNLDNDIEKFEDYLKNCEIYFEKGISYFNMNINFSN